MFETAYFLAGAFLVVFFAVVFFATLVAAFFVVFFAAFLAMGNLLFRAEAHYRFVAIRKSYWPFNKKANSCLSSGTPLVDIETAE